MKVLWSYTAWQEYIEWQHSDRTVTSKINDLIEDIRRNPIGKGIGKVGRLKGKFMGWSSRRITQERRLVYRVVGRASNA
jgi:toxin YoeB